jgi:hypothetical protein
MITTLPTLLMENAFLTWLFNDAPAMALAMVLAWGTWRVASSYGSYQIRFTKIESDLHEVKSEVTDMKKDVDSRFSRVEGRMDRLDGRMDGLEDQLRIVIDLLKEKKSVS